MENRTQKNSMKTICGFIVGVFLFIYVFGNVCALALTSSDTGEDFWIRFIDVGQGDSALICCDGHYMLIDGGPSSASSILYTVLKDNGIEKLDYVIATHPDLDHIGGISGALNYSTVGVCYSPILSYDTKTFNNMIKCLKKQKALLKIPTVGGTISLGTAKITFLGPTGEVKDDNNNSIVAKLSYGDTSFIFMGDAETEEESAIIEQNKSITCDVIKIGHHGSASSTSELFLKTVKPKYAIISVGKDNFYRHPSQATLDRLIDSNIKIYRTDLQGDITVYSDGTTLSVKTEKQQTADEIISKTVEIPEGTTYVINKNTKRFHLVDCDSVYQMKKRNRAFSSQTSEELIEQGFVPCGNCRPDVVDISKSSD